MPAFLPLPFAVHSAFRIRTAPAPLGASPYGAPPAHVASRLKGRAVPLPFAVAVAQCLLPIAECLPLPFA